MAGYTEMVEARNPALVGTGLALWGWILRLTVGLSFIFLPLVVNSVNPVVDNLQYAQTAPNGHAPFNVQQFQVEHPASWSRSPRPTPAGCGRCRTRRTPPWWPRPTPTRSAAWPP